jgi:hypothetical protein
VSMSREKNLDKRLALNTKRLTVVPRKPNTIELDPSDLMNKAVKEIDAQLSVIYGYIAMALAMRQHKAAMEDVEAPPPAPPRVATVLHLVCERERLRFVLERDRGQYGSENLLLRDPHVVARAGKERRRNVTATARHFDLAAARSDRGAFAFADREIFQDFPLMDGMDDRTNHCFRIKWVADFDAPCLRGNGRRELFIYACFHEKARG